jgi:Family of unknown function (DUF5677)
VAVNPEIVEQFRPQFEACDALYEFAANNRPEPSGFSAVEGLLLDTYARSTKTFQAIIRLAYVGYGEQAIMLGRPLFEDMIVGHWIRRNPDAVRRLEEFRLLTVERLREKGNRYSKPDVLEQLPTPIARERRDELNEKFSGNRHWTGLSLDALVKSVEDEWPEDGNQRGLVWEVYEFDCFQANHLIHHGHAGLSAGRTERPGRRSYNVGASPRYIREALRIGFFSYANTLTLVIPETQEFDALYEKYFLQAGFSARSG